MTSEHAKLISAVPTLFDDSGAVALKDTRRVYEDLAQHDIDGVFVAGTTGEFTTLDDEERLGVASLAIDAFGSHRTYVHVGAASTRHAVDLARRAVDQGAELLAAVTPYYFPATESAVLNYYSTLVAESGSAGVYAYLFKARTTTTVTPALLARIADTGVAGVKISGEPRDSFQRFLAALAGRELPAYSGSDAEFREVVADGGAGVVSGVSSVLPKPFLEVRAALRSGDESALEVARQRANRAVHATRNGNLAHLKATLELRGFASGGLRAPLDPISDAERAQLARSVDDLV